MAGRVVPGSVVPGNIVPGRVVPGRVVPGKVVPGKVVPGKVVPVKLGSVVPFLFAPGRCRHLAGSYRFWLQPVEITKMATAMVQNICLDRVCAAERIVERALRVTNWVYMIGWL